MPRDPGPVQRSPSPPTEGDVRILVMVRGRLRSGHSSREQFGAARPPGQLRCGQTGTGRAQTLIPLLPCRILFEILAPARSSSARATTYRDRKRADHERLGAKGSAGTQPRMGSLLLPRCPSTAGRAQSPWSDPPRCSRSSW